MVDATPGTPRPTTIDANTTINDAVLPSGSENDDRAVVTEVNEMKQDVPASPIQSQETETNEEPQAGDIVRTASAKRKRTSPEDQAILEAEYKSNPKPDKAARLEIVNKVSLGEKAVQIWFQNRRQNTRRKSRPLLPHEIAAFGLGGMAALSADPVATYSNTRSSGLFGPASQPGSPTVQETGNAGYQQLRAAAMKAPSSSAPVAIMSTPQKVDVNDQEPERVGLPSFSASFPGPQDHERSRPLNEKSSSQPILPLPVTTPGYLANRRSASSSYFATPSTAIVHPPFITPLPQPLNSLHSNSVSNGLLTPLGHSPDSASQVRLCYSSDGKASLVSSLDIISPPQTCAPRPTSSITPIPFPSRRMSSLQRSHSALPFSSPLSRVDAAPVQSSNIEPSILAHQSNIPTPRLFSGRSKDARAWEFCCDSEARDELTQQAENESHGSAIAAISLLRSTSGAALKSNQNKRNAPISLYRTEKDHRHKRPKMGRAQSSLARMQGSPHLAQKEHLESSSISHKSVRDGAVSPSDSDKENWVPLEGGGHRRIQGSGHSANSSNSMSRRRVLGTSVGPSPAKGSNSNDAVTPKELAADVASFMSAPVSPSKKGDLDCIQGLLSLSQGNWR